MNTPNDSLLGKQIDEYRIDKALGQGGMARVYRALDIKLERYVALKVIAPDFRTDEEYESRFTREAQSIARLNHPNIVHIYRFGEIDGIYYMAMQYVEGADVGWLIEDYRTGGELMPIRDVVRIVQDIGSALDYAHSKNVIHRDIKPSNIMVDSQGRAILTDFGLALLSDQGTRGQIFGSPHYISPEQAISSGNVVPQSDLYALGVTLFEMLTGDLPFADGEPMDIAMRHVSETAPPPSQFNKAIPPIIDEVVLKSLAKEPYERYLTGAELSAALQSGVENWQSGNQPVSEATRRPSLISAPQKVSDLMRMSPVPAQPTPLPARRSRERSALADTLPPPSASATQPGPQIADRQKSTWLYPLLLAGALFTVGLIGLLLFVLSPRNDNATAIAVAPTATSTMTASPATIAVSQTPVPSPSAPPAQIPTAIPTFTAVVLPTIVPSPTLVPTVTAIVLTTAAPSPTSIPPTLAFTVSPIPPTPTSSSKIAPPDNRDVPPAGSVRLGDFAVEGFCNSRGYGVTLVNNDNDWACTNTSTGAVVLVLAPSDFDSICRGWYANPDAFAIRDQHNAKPAYNWSCYVYAASTAVPPPTSSPVLVATPSIFTLILSYKADWVALINVSPVQLSLDQLEFKHADRTLNSSAWGRTVLNPGECLRIFKGDKSPKESPDKCSTVLDYNADKKEREYWLKGPIYVTISSSITYCYPGKQCPS